MRVVGQRRGDQTSSGSKTSSGAAVISLLVAFGCSPATQSKTLCPKARVKPPIVLGYSDVQLDLDRKSDGIASLGLPAVSANGKHVVALVEQPSKPPRARRRFMLYQLSKSGRVEWQSQITLDGPRYHKTQKWLEGLNRRLAKQRWIPMVGPADAQTGVDPYRAPGSLACPPGQKGSVCFGSFQARYAHRTRTFLLNHQGKPVRQAMLSPKKAVVARCGKPLFLASLHLSVATHTLLVELGFDPNRYCAHALFVLPLTP
jgi:hypothetical protein